MPRSWLARAQVVEYLRSFLIGRTGWASLGTLLLISGAFGVYRRDVVIEAGGLDPDSIGEDFELCLRVHKMMRDQRRDYRVVFVPEPVCWTEVPSYAGRAAPPAQPVAPRAVGDAVGLPRDAVPPPVRADRLGRPAVLLALRAGRAAHRGRRPGPRAAGRTVRRRQRAVRPGAAPRLLRLRDLRDARGDVRRGVGLPPLRPVARPRHRGRRRRLREPRLPPDDGAVAARGVVGQPARQEAGVGRHDPGGFEEEAA